MNDDIFSAVPGASENELLRQKAEARLGSGGSKGSDPAGAAAHELELYRIELEIQNQSLQELRGEAETAMHQLAEINSKLEELVVTRTAQLEEALRTAERNCLEKSRFLSTMSHELRNPLNAIMGMTSLAMRLAVDSKQRRYLGIVERSLRDLHGIVNDILDVSKIEAGGLCLRKTRFTLDDLLQGVEGLNSLLIERKGLHLVFELPPECSRLPLAGDYLRIKQVLMNLVGNAAKFTEQGSIHVRCKSIGGDERGLRLRFEIEDTGAGIGPEDRKRLFVPFAQLGGSPGAARDGSGLGLAISKKLVTAMGGRSEW